MNPTPAEPLDLSGWDISTRAQEGVEMPLLDPAGRPSKIKFRVRGTDCEAYSDMSKAHIRRMRDAAPRKPTEEEQNAQFWELHATLVPSWDPPRLMFKKEWGAMDCTPANVAKVLEAFPDVFEQVRRFADKRANFLPGPSSN